MISSLFHYNFIKENESAASDLEGNVEFLKQKRSFTFEAMYCGCEKELLTMK
jgi:cyclase